MRAIDVIINAIFRYTSTKTSKQFGSYYQGRRIIPYRLTNSQLELNKILNTCRPEIDLYMHEQVVNLHMHSVYSDGHGTHHQIAAAALNSDVDIVIVTDHNVLVHGVEGYYQNNHRKILLLIGEEIHDQTRQPQKNHLLVFGANKELSPQATNTQQLIDDVRASGGLSFLAHPVDPAAPAVGEGDLSWENWDIVGFTGIELWNAMSEFKSHLKTKLHAIYYAFNPNRIASRPFSDAIKKWDELLAAGKRIVAVGGSDAHALPGKLGPLQKTLFPYEYHFRTINTHIFTTFEMSGDLNQDRKMVLSSLERGNAFIGYDLPASTRGFRFTAKDKDRLAWMGDTVSGALGVTFQIRIPYPAECSLLKDGLIVKTWYNLEHCTYITSDPGVYRVEVHIDYLGRKRGWIYSNPIFIR